RAGPWCEDLGFVAPGPASLSGSIWRGSTRLRLSNRHPLERSQFRKPRLQFVLGSPGTRTSGIRRNRQEAIGPFPYCPPSLYVKRIHPGVAIVSNPPFVTEGGGISRVESAVLTKPDVVKLPFCGGQHQPPSRTSDGAGSHKGMARDRWRLAGR